MSAIFTIYKHNISFLSLEKFENDAEELDVGNSNELNLNKFRRYLHYNF